MNIAKKIFGSTLTTALIAIPAFALANPNDMDPGPPPGFICNGVTCEGWIVTGYDGNGDPILSYVVIPDSNYNAPHPE